MSDEEKITSEENGGDAAPTEVPPPEDTSPAKDDADENTKEVPKDADDDKEKAPEPKPAKKRVPVTKIDGEAEIVLEEAGPGARQPITVFELFEDRVRKYESVDALCEKRDGEWKRWTYGQHLNEVKRTAKAFIALGLEPFHAVGIIGFNAPEWLFADLGAIYAGGVSAGIYTTNSPEACKYVLEDSRANIAVCENDAQVQKILKVRDELPHLKAIIQYKGELKQKEKGLYTWEEMLKEGESVDDSALEDRKKGLKPSNCCLLVYTSGTTGNPKGVMMSHDNVTWTAIELIERVFTKTADEHKGNCNAVSYLPLSHIAAQLCDVFGSMTMGMTVYFAQPDALKGSLKVTMGEVRPHFFFGVPRVFEKFMEAIQKAVLESSGLRRRLFDWASDKALRGNKNLEKGESTPWGWTIAKVILKKIHKTLGLDRAFNVWSAAAPLNADTHNFFLSINMPLCQVYGMSECSGPHTLGVIGETKAGTCGKVFTAGVKTKFDNPDEHGDGEVCMYGRHVFMGYHGMEEKSREAIDEDGWLHSGDIGHFDKDGYLSITGRIKELIITAGGENIAPVPIEDSLKSRLPFISNIMLIGDRKKFLSCLVTLKVIIDPDTAAATDELQAGALHALKQLGCSTTKCSEILESQNEVVFKEIQRAIDEYNKHDAISRAQHIQKWTLLGGDFTIAGGELGPTLKLKRSVVVKKYQETIDAFYQES